LPEATLKEEISNYLKNLLSNEENFIKDIIKNFNKLYKSKDANSQSEKELKNRLKKLQNNKIKTKEMYQDSAISREEMREDLAKINKEIEQIEDKLKVISYNLTKADQLEYVLEHTFSDLDEIINLDEMANEQLKKIIDKIEVNPDGNIYIYLKMFTDIGLTETVRICSNRT
jgi:septal ring factor EnvC (AmiA/AmiB activator)